MNERRVLHCRRDIGRDHLVAGVLRDQALSYKRLESAP